MKVFLVLEETSFYQPDFVAKLLRNKAYTYVGAALVTKIPPKGNIEAYFKKHWYYLTIMEIFKLGIKTLVSIINNYFSFVKKDATFHSVSAVLKYYKVDYIEVHYDIHKEVYLDFIRSKEPDVIISSNPLIFKKKILSIPKICAINRHASLLPAYAGLLPVMHAYRQGEEYVGVTLHTMDTKIDGGTVLSQGKIKIQEGDTVDTLYQKCFDISADLCFQALEKIKSGHWQNGHIKSNIIPSYFAFPTKDQWSEFRKRKGKMI